MLVLPADPAAAHFCAFPVSIKPGKSATVNVGVAAEDTSIVEVAITVPEGFRLDRALDVRRWTTTNDGTTVRFTGGPIDEYSCGFFSLVGTADSKGTLVFPLTVVDNKGTVFEYTSQRIGDPYAAQLVFARTLGKAKAKSKK